MAENETTRACPQCGNPLPGDAPQGLCPSCLLKNGLASEANTTPTYPRSAMGSRASYRGGRFIPPTVEELAPLFPQMEILELLGQGGMGAVYKAKQRGLDRLVAVKILPPDLGEIPGFADRFTREARALAKLNHPNIVSVFDFGRTVSMNEAVGQAGDATLPRPLPGREGSENGLYYLVMEYIDGVNLRQAMRTKSMTPPEALAIVPQVCEALQFAHDEGIVHRDIKPENILIDKRGKVKIADFGLAKLIAGAASPDDITLTREGGTMGTPHYMAPEQIEGAHGVDHRADIYSLGVVFYEMLTGELPLGRFAAPSKKVKIDVRLDEIVLRTLEKEPELRYQHASEVKTQVDGIRGMSPAAVQRAFGTEFKSKATVLGIPLLHIAFGLDPKTGRKRVAKGIIAIGDVAVGMLAFGGAAFGGVTLGGIGIGLISISGVAIALLLATGGVALGAFAFGGLAIGGVALGGCAVGIYTFGGANFGLHNMATGGAPEWLNEVIQPGSDRWIKWLTLLSMAVPAVGLLGFLFVWLVFYFQSASRGPDSGGPRGGATAADPHLDAAGQVRGPAVCMMIASVINWVTLSILAITFVGSAASTQPDPYSQQPNLMMWPLLAVGLVMMVLSGFQLFAALKMKRLEGRGMAVLGSLVSMVTTPGNLIGLPAGIWSLAVLGRAEVIEAFDRKRGVGPGAATSPRPLSVPVFGVLNILAGIALLFIITLAAIPGQKPTPADQLWIDVTPAYDVVHAVERYSVPFQFIGAGLLFAAGIGMLMWRGWGRSLAVGVCVYMLIDFVVQVPVIALGGIAPLWKLTGEQAYLSEMGFADEAEAMQFAVFITLFVAAMTLAMLTYFIAQLVVLNRPRVVEAFAAGNPGGSGAAAGLAVDVRLQAGEGDKSGFACAIIAIVCFLLGVLGPLIVVAGWPDRPAALPVALFGAGHLLAVFFGLLGFRHRLGKATVLIALLVGLGAPSFFYVWSSGGPVNRDPNIDNAGVTYFEGHGSIVKGVAVSRDGRFLASVGMDGRLIVRELPGGNIRNNILTSEARRDRPDSPLYSVAFTPDGDVLAGGNPESVSVLRVTPAQGDMEAITAPTRGPVRGIMSFDRGRKFAYVAGDSEVVFFDPAEGAAAVRSPIYPNKAFGNVRAVAGSPDGRFIAVTSSNMTGDGAGGAQSIDPCMLSVYDNTGEQRLSFQIDQYSDFSYAQIVFADARTLVMCLPSGRMQKWKLGNDDEWALVASPRISAGRYTAIAASKDGKVIWLAHQDEIVGIDAETGEGIAFAQLDPGQRAKEFASFPIEAIVPTGEPLTVAAALWNGKVAVARCVSLEENRRPRPQVGGSATAPAVDVELEPVKPRLPVVEPGPITVEFRAAVAPTTVGQKYYSPATSSTFELLSELRDHGPTALHRRQTEFRWAEVVFTPLKDDTQMILGEWKGRRFLLTTNEEKYMMTGGKPADAPKSGDKESNWRIEKVTLHKDLNDETKFRVHVTFDELGEVAIYKLTPNLQGHPLAVIAGGKCMGLVSLPPGKAMEELDFEGLSAAESAALVAALRDGAAPPAKNAEIEPAKKVDPKEGASAKPLPTLEQLLGKWEAAKALTNDAARGPAMAGIVIEASNGVTTLDPDLTEQMAHEMVGQVTNQALRDDTFATSAINLARRGHTQTATTVAKLISESVKRDATLAAIAATR